MDLPGSDAYVASEQVLAELYSTAEMSIKPHIVVALVLHKVVDPVRPCTHHTCLWLNCAVTASQGSHFLAENDR